MKVLFKIFITGACIELSPDLKSELSQRLLFVVIALMISLPLYKYLWSP